MARRKIDTSQALFTDFSKGLYLLDTPRGYGDQLQSLALVGGRNVWSEKGALVPQYGYDIKAIIPNNEKVLLVSEDDQSSSSVFIITQDIETNKGNVYLYTASEGLKKYKTKIPSVTTPIISARTGANLILTTAGINYEFGAYYPESPEESLDTDIPISTYATYYEISVAEDQKDYYWNGKEIALKAGGKTIPVKVVGITKNETSIPASVEAEQVLNYLLEGDRVRIEGNFTISDLEKEAYSYPFGENFVDHENYSIKVGYGKPTNSDDVMNINFQAPLVFDEGEYKAECFSFNIEPYPEKTYKYKMYLEATKATIEIYSGDTLLDSQTINSITILNWLTMFGQQTTNYLEVQVFVNDELVTSRTESTLRLRLVTLQGTQHQALTGEVDVIEQTINTLTFKYIPEEPTESNPEKVITPAVMGFCANRLCISDIGGVIYYSGVGVIDNFEESLGAGYFGGFSDDNSACLSLEDYYNGVLITKQNGLYFLAFGADSTSSVSATSTIGISIKKIAQIGQEYAKDHVIIDKQIIAYDTNSASLVVAAAVNVFGSLVAGKTLVTAEELNAQSFGIPEGKRQLVYNSEAQVLILYYGEQLRNGMVYVPQAKAIFSREMDITIEDFQGFNQGVIGISEDGKVFQDFKKGTLIESLTAIANFEPIGLRDNRIICASLLEISELNGIEYTLTTTNTQTSLQYIVPPSSISAQKQNTPPMLYSDKKANLSFDSFATKRKWAEKLANCTRVYAPLSGRYGVNLSFEFPQAEAFCLVAIRISDFSQGN